jgi:hypothetical protein
MIKYICDTCDTEYTATVGDSSMSFTVVSGVVGDLTNLVFNVSLADYTMTLASGTYSLTCSGCDA